MGLGLHSAPSPLIMEHTYVRLPITERLPIRQHDSDGESERPCAMKSATPVLVPVLAIGVHTIDLHTEILQAQRHTNLADLAGTAVDLFEFQCSFSEKAVVAKMLMAPSALPRFTPELVARGPPFSCFTATQCTH